jgi:hypothetical protein
MKWIVLFLAVVTVSVAGLKIVGYEEDARLPKLAWTMLESEYSLPKDLTVDPSLELGGRAMVYKLVRIPVTANRVMCLAGNLGLPEEHYQTVICSPCRIASREEYGLRIANDKSIGEYRSRKTGEFVRLVDDGEYTYDDPRTESMDEGNAPSEEECKGIAISFLRRSGLMPKGSKLVAEYAGGSGGTSYPENGARPVETVVSVDIDVKIHHQSIPTDNAWAEFEIVKGGRVRYMILNLPMVRSVRTYPLKTSRELLAAVQSHQAFYNTGCYFAEYSCVIDSCRVQYTRNRNDLVIPMYYYTGYVTKTPLQLMPRHHGGLTCWGSTAAVKQRYLFPFEPWHPQWPPQHISL